MNIICKTLLRAPCSIETISFVLLSFFTLTKTNPQKYPADTAGPCEYVTKVGKLFREHYKGRVRPNVYSQREMWIPKFGHMEPKRPLCLLC